MYLMLIITGSPNSILMASSSQNGERLVMARANLKVLTVSPLIVVTMSMCQTSSITRYRNLQARVALSHHGVIVVLPMVNLMHHMVLQLILIIVCMSLIVVTTEFKNSIMQVDFLRNLALLVLFSHVLKMANSMVQMVSEYHLQAVYMLLISEIIGYRYLQ